MPLATAPVYACVRVSVYAQAANAFLRGAKIIYKAVNAGLLAGAGVVRLRSFSLTSQ